MLIWAIQSSFSSCIHEKGEFNLFLPAVVTLSTSCDCCHLTCLLASQQCQWSVDEETQLLYGPNVFWTDICSRKPFQLEGSA